MRRSTALCQVAVLGLFSCAWLGCTGQNTPATGPAASPTATPNTASAPAAVVEPTTAETPAGDSSAVTFVSLKVPNMH